MKEHVVLIISNKERKTLFVQRSLQKKSLPGKWAFPSGTIEEGEDPQTAAIREAKEELDIDVKAIEIIATKELPEFSSKLFFMLCDAKDQEPIINEPDEIEKMQFMTFSDFFATFTDDDIGHGLVWLRKHPEIWKKYGI